MNVHRYRRLSAALSLSLFLASLTSRLHGSAGSGLTEFFGVLVFSALLLFLVTSSSSIHEGIAATLNLCLRCLYVPQMHSRLPGRVAVIRVLATVVAQPFRFQLPPPATGFSL